MKEAVEEFGSAMIVCLIGLIVIFGVAKLISNSGALVEFAKAYATFFYGAPA